MFFFILSVLASLSDDSKLVHALRQRDPDALGQIYDRYGKLAFAVIVRVVRDRGVAEDLLQETFLKVWNRGASFDAERGALGPWILTIARNRAIDYLRSTESRHSEWAGDLEKLERTRLFVDLEGQYVHSDRMRVIRSAFTKLNENQKRVLELAYFEGLSQSEMATRLQQPLGTIKTWVRTALQTLRQELGEAAARA
jgi:RNA polymerase sigma-70 factor, ECF subfamily